MTPTETATILRQFNEWLRGNKDGPQLESRDIRKAIDAAVEMIDRIEVAEKDIALKERVIDSLGSELNAAAGERDELRAKIEQQKPVGIVHRYGRALNGSAWLGVAWNPEADELPTGTAIYALPGAQPAPSVPEDVMRDAERYRYLRARDEETAGVGCWLEAKGRVCDRGWLYGDQLDSAIDTCIEMLAAAPEAKP